MILKRRSSARGRWLACVSSLALAAGLVACGGDDSGEATGAEGGDGGGEIVIGANLPMTGQASVIGKIGVGMQAYVDTVNEDGGINGHKLRLVVQDDQGNPATAPGVARKLVEEEGAAIICGTGGTAPYAAISDYLGAKQVPGVPASGTSTLLNDHTFQVITKYEQVSARLVDFAVDELGIDKVAVAAGRDDIGKGMAEGATAQAKARGIGAPTVVEFDPAATSFGAEAAKLKASGAGFVIINGTLPTITNIIKATNQVGYRPEWGTTWAGLDPQFMELAGSHVDGHSYFATPFLQSEQEDAAAYIEGMKKHAPGEDARSLYPLEGWTLAEACVEGIRAAVEKVGGVPTSQQVMEAMNDLSIDTEFVRGLKWTQDDHQGAREVQILALEDGEFVERAPFAAPVGGGAN